MRRLHRWLALSLGAWFALLGLTGAVLVFEPEIEAWGIRSPGPGSGPGSGRALPLDELTAAAREAGPPGLLRIWPAPGPGERFRADFRNEHGRTTLYLDPASGAVLGEVRQGTHVVNWLHALHRGLLLGRPGDVLVGLLGLPLVALLAAGLGLWLRRDALPWREKLISIAGLRGRRRIANQHRALGFRAALPLLIAALTGIGMAFPQTLQWALYRVIRTIPPPLSRPGEGPVDLAGAAALALAERPGWRVAFIDLPQPGRPPLHAIELAPAAPWPGQGATVRIDPATGALVEIVAADPVGRIRGWIIALHAGTVLGLPHRLAMLVVGLLPLVLGWLGLRLWWRARQARRRLRA
jgi:uncharacterized iron-regulated membrane protein